MTKREVVQTVLDGRVPPYVPWHISLALEAREKMREYYRQDDLEQAMGNHLLHYGDPIGYMKSLDNHRVADHFGVIWNRSVDKDIGVVEHYQLDSPTLRGYQFPDPDDHRFYEELRRTDPASADKFPVYQIGFSLFERAWTLRGMEQLYMDMIDDPAFVHRLLGAIADFNIEVVSRVCDWGVDAVYFGDDWGAQQGLLMGPSLWYEFIYPQIKRMYRAVTSRGRYVFIHSCGDVDELFDSLIEAGLTCFNPFQPEVMDVFSLLEAYRGRLCFHGGLSTQQTLPYGTAEDVVCAVNALLEAGSRGGYIFSPAHAVEGDVSAENLAAMMETITGQQG